MDKIKVTLAKGDGIGLEITDAVLDILEAAGAPLEYEEINVGEQVYLKGIKTGIPDDAWDTITRNGTFLKGPITTPQGGGYKSLNVTIRKTLGLFANVRPVKAYSPYIQSHFPKMDVVVVRENEEDLYAGIEHQQTPEVVQALKLISRPGSEKIIRYAFEYAKAHGRKKVTCMSKDNIMKHADGLFHKVFDEVKEEYPEIESEHYIIDIGTARIANDPERFDVIVTLNLYGDIISDVTAEIAGSVGMGGSSNVGENVAMFEAIHGSAPDIAGKNIANPSGLLNGACMMLVHLNLADHAYKIQNALLKTIEDGIHTGDLKSELTKELVGTKEFAQAVIERLGQKPANFSVPKPSNHKIQLPQYSTPRATKTLVGVDVYLDWNESNRRPSELGKQLEQLAPEGLELKTISNRGIAVYPGVDRDIFCSDHWSCRFVSPEHSSTKGKAEIDKKLIVELLNSINNFGLDFIKTENIYTFSGERAYSLAQGEVS